MSSIVSTTAPARYRIAGFAKLVAHYRALPRTALETQIREGGSADELEVLPEHDERA